MPIKYIFICADKEINSQKSVFASMPHENMVVKAGIEKAANPIISRVSN